MPTRIAFTVALLLLLPGVALRVVPYFERRAEPPVRLEREAVTAAGDSRLAGLLSVPSRLSQRPLVLLAAGVAAEVALHASAIVLLLRSRPLVAVLAAGSPVGKAVRLLFAVALSTGFLAGSPATFPFVPWRMYSGLPENPPSAYLLHGVTRGGASVRLHLGDVLPVLGPHRAYGLVAARAEAVERTWSDADRQLLSEALVRVGRAYNLSQGREPLRRVSVYWAVIPLDRRGPPWLHAMREVASVDIF